MSYDMETTSKSRDLWEKYKYVWSRVSAEMAERYQSVVEKSQKTIVW